MTRPQPPGGLAPPIGDLPTSDAACCFEIYPAPGGTPDLATLRSAVLATVATAGSAADHAWHVDSLEGCLTASTDVEPPWRRTGPTPPSPSCATARTASTRPPAFATSPNTRDGGPCLWGRLTYGDAVADEWLAAWLLRHITASLPGVAARVWDEDDGEFLLIEAAPGLPRWVTPDVAADRVWFAGGDLHLVPPPATGEGRQPKRRLPAGSPTQPTAAQALALVRDPGMPTTAGPKLVAALAPRLDGAPAAAARGVHRARLTLPAGLAAVLAAEPGAVAAATAEFVAATPAARRAASGGAPSFTLPLATVVARFSRLQYAQYALAPAGPAPAGWPVLAPDAPAEAVAARDLGAKVAAGFALLLASGSALTSGKDGGPPADPAILSTLPEWRAFLAALAARGAFDGEAEGSARRRQLTATAAADFASSAAGRAAAARRAAPALRVRQVLASPIPDVAVLEAAGAGAVPDSDAWMSDGGAALDAEVDALEAAAAAAAAGPAAKPPPRRRGAGAQPSSSSSPFDPAAVVAQVKAFVEGMSSFEGAEAPPEPPGGGAPTADAPPPPAADGPLSLDGADFWRELGACLGVGPDELFGGGGSGGGGGGAGAAADAINALFGSDMDDDDDEDYDTSEEEGSSFYDGPSDEEGEDESSSEDEEGRPAKPSRSGAAALSAERARLAALERGRGSALRAGPPPEDDGFEAAYAATLDAQLAGSTLAETFVDGGGGGGGGPTAAAARGPIVPVDVDANLLASLLASHAGAGGGGGRQAADLPGPAAGLAAMLGVRLPDARPPPPPPAVQPAAAEHGAPGLAPPPATPNTSRG